MSIDKDTFAKDYVDVAVKDGVQAADAWVVEQNGGEVPDAAFIEEMAPAVRDEIIARQEAAKTEPVADQPAETLQDDAAEVYELPVAQGTGQEEVVSESDTEASE